MSALDGPAVLAARLQGSRDALARMLADGDLNTRHDGASWLPARSSVLVGPDGRIVWASSWLPDTLAGAR